MGHVLLLPPVHRDAGWIFSFRLTNTEKRSGKTEYFFIPESRPPS